MTEKTRGQDLEAAGPRWNGDVEWSNDWERSRRHWWRLHPKDPILIHRASGEQVAYCGERDEPGWHRFEYRHGEVRYPLAVEMKRVWWPNPRAGQSAGPRGEDREPDELRLFIWRVDHLRSADLWRQAQKSGQDSDQPPPYWLWRRVDHAVTDAALLWPKKYTSEINAADDVAINGGWLNGTWHTDYFRRIRRHNNFDQYRPHSFGPTPIPGWPLPATIRDLGLPLTDYQLDSIETESPRWEHIADSAPVARGVRAPGRVLMRNDLVGAHMEAASLHAESAQRPSTALVVQRDGIAWMMPASLNARGWTIQMDGPCSVSSSQGVNPIDVSWLPKPVLPFDGIGRNCTPTYDPSVISHPLASYQSWRFLYDGLVNALPFSDGLGIEKAILAPAQREFGELKILGGFAGGTQTLVTEVRLKLRLPNDRDDAAWSKLFSDSA